MLIEILFSTLLASSSSNHDGVDCKSEPVVSIEMLDAVKGRAQENKNTKEYASVSLAFEQIPADMWLLASSATVLKKVIGAVPMCDLVTAANSDELRSQLLVGIALQEGLGGLSKILKRVQFI